jgi:hypothetical protein
MEFKTGPTSLEKSPGILLVTWFRKEIEVFERSWQGLAKPLVELFRVPIVSELLFTSNAD